MRQKMTFYLLLSLLVPMLSFAKSDSPIVQPSLHLIVIAQTSDRTIGAAKDFETIQDRSTQIAAYAGLALVPYFFEKENLTADALTQLLEAIPSNTDDVIWFYYMGHGFNTDKGLGNFPGFKLDDTKFAQEWVHEKLESKAARLVITMYDCCNFQTEDFSYDEPVMLSAPLNENYIALFGESHGSVRMASNAAGYRQYSYGSPDVGGLFTVAFFGALDEITIGDYQQCSWTKLAELTKSGTQRFAKNIGRAQLPYVEIDVIRHH